MRTYNTLNEEYMVPFGGDILKSLDAAVDLGTLACIQTLDSSNDDSGLGSGSNDDWTFTEMGDYTEDASAITSLN